MFTWIPIHKETIQRIVTKPISQQELLGVLKEMEQSGLKVINLQDTNAAGETAPLAEIDPFTFLASFNRGITDENRRANWKFLKEHWNLEAPVPDDFAGIPVMFPLNSWFFPFASNRPKGQIESLWSVVKEAAGGGFEGLDPETFDKCRGLPRVNLNRLSIGLFWINPEKFLPADRKTVAYGKAKGISTAPTDCHSYQEWQKEMTELLGSNYPQISHEAHLFAAENHEQLELTPERVQNLWQRFKSRVPGFVDFRNPGPSFVKEETNYKRGILAKFQQQLGLEKLAALAGEGKGVDALNQIGKLLVNPPANFVAYYGWKTAFGTGDEAICDVLTAFVQVASNPYQGSQSTQPIFDACALHKIKPKWDVLGALLWALRPEDYFPIKISHYRDLSTELGHDMASGLPDANKLDHVIAFGRAFWEMLEPFSPSDWVDVQSFIWCVCPNSYKEKGKGGEAPGPGGAEIKEVAGPAKPQPPPPVLAAPYDKSQAMADLFLSELQFDELLAALSEKRNLVVQGSPGVGKTFVAKRLAYTLLRCKAPQRVEMIQFHQSYSYEDFVQGYRPASDGTFLLKHGLFYEFCVRAQRDEVETDGVQPTPYVFIIDEINRGNLSKIFGELLMLIEPDKRGKDYAIPLTYSQPGDQRFYIPKNLYLIGMMNTADRSLAMVDYALRRRFRFIDLQPEFRSDKFQSFLQQAGVNQDLIRAIVDRLSELNKAICGDAKNLGPGYQIGHSYFCPTNRVKPDETWYCRIIRSEVIPLLKEYWFDSAETVEKHRKALLAGMEP